MWGMTPQHKECDPRHTGNALQSCCTTAALCKMMSSTRHVQALLLLQLGLQHYCKEMMKGNGVTWPLRTINSLKLQEGISSGENTPQTSLEIENTSK